MKTPNYFPKNDAYKLGKSTALKFGDNEIQSFADGGEYTPVKGSEATDLFIWTAPTEKKPASQPMKASIAAAPTSTD